MATDTADRAVDANSRLALYDDRWESGVGDVSDLLTYLV